MQPPHRRKFLHLAAGSAALPALSHIARAQTYPARPVRIVVGFTPGGGLDINARLIGQSLSERLGQQFVVENRPGAGSHIAAESVANAAPDGYTLLLVGTPNAINATLYQKPSFNFIRDIAPVACISREPLIMIVNPSVPATSVSELIAYGKANSGRIALASPGNGSTNHVTGELFKMMAGVNMIHVPYRGAAPALTDLLSGQVQVYFATVSSSLEYIKAGKLRPLAVTSSARSSLLPVTPTVAEFIPGFEASAWYGLGAPKNTPAAIIEKLNRETSSALTDPKLKARLADLGLDLMPMTVRDFQKFIVEEADKWGKVVKFSGAKAE
jgi:tripartite-type tricarboxylate transporter receptor subunit TctC